MTTLTMRRRSGARAIASAKGAPARESGEERAGVSAGSAESRRGILRAPAGSQRRGQGRPNKSPARGTGLSFLSEGACRVATPGKPTDKIHSLLHRAGGDVQFALSFRPQSIFLRDRGEAFAFVKLTSAPSPDPRSTLRFCEGRRRTCAPLHALHKQAGMSLSHRCLGLSHVADDADPTTSG
jgi:hypothetical protein